jgi:hypothetical protein
MGCIPGREDKMKKKVTIYLEDWSDKLADKPYVVRKIVNSIEFYIDEELSRDDVRTLINKPLWTVNIQERRNRR